MAATAVGVQPSNKLTRLIERITGALKTKDGEYHVVVVSIGEGAREGVFVGIGVVAGTYLTTAATAKYTAAVIAGFTVTAISKMNWIDRLGLSNWGYFNGTLFSKMDCAVHSTLGMGATLYFGPSYLPAFLAGTVSNLALENTVKTQEKYVEVFSGIAAGALTPACVVTPMITNVVVSKIAQKTGAIPSIHIIKDNQKIWRTTVITTVAVAGGFAAGPVGAVAAAIFSGALWGYFSHKSKAE